MLMDIFCDVIKQKLLFFLGERTMNLKEENAKKFQAPRTKRTLIFHLRIGKIFYEEDMRKLSIKS